MEAKAELLKWVNKKTKTDMNMNTLTLGFARRMTAYKRASNIFTDPERLKAIIEKQGPVQIIYSGKAHPKDGQGKELIKTIYRLKEELKDNLKIAWLENYNMHLGGLITSGVDVWLNTPIPPMEASGTSGMKSALNGVPSLSILDGWWIEGCQEGITGWAIGDGDRQITENEGVTNTEDASVFYAKLENEVMPVFYNDRETFIGIMRNAIALNGSFFNTQRMMQQYVVKAYI